MITKPTPMIIDGVAVIAVPYEDSPTTNPRSGCDDCIFDATCCDRSINPTAIDICMKLHCYYKDNSNEAQEQAATIDAS